MKTLAMRFAVESWAPEYGAPSTDETLTESSADVDAWVERKPDDWAPVLPPARVGPLDNVLFVDGVRRVEANVWISGASGEVHQGLCASFAAGGVLCNGGAGVVGPLVRHGLFCGTTDAEPIVTRHARFELHASTTTDPKELTLLLQDAMAHLEVEVASRNHATAHLVVVDGPLRQGHDGCDTESVALVGYVKTHTTSYGPTLVRETVARLEVGERTPVMLIGGRRPKFSWYMRLPCVIDHGWAGVVRLETLARHPVGDVVSFADQLARTLPKFASVPHKDPRAPQNLYPVGGLERELRRRLGDPALHYRALRVAAHENAMAATAP